MRHEVTPPYKRLYIYIIIYIYHILTSVSDLAYFLQVVVSALAILMVGGVYVPCDDRLPWQRVQHMVEDAGVILILAGPVELYGTGLRVEQPTFLIARTAAAAADPILNPCR